MNDTGSDDSAQYWTVRCAPGSVLCNVTETFIVIVTGSYDVTLRFEDSGSTGNCDIARVRVKENSKASDRVVVQLVVIDGFQVLELSAKEDNVDVVLLQKERVKQLINQGSGDVVVLENVHVVSGPRLIFSNIGSGNIFIKPSTPITVDTLELGSGNGNIQASFYEFDVKTFVLDASSSGFTTVVVESNATVDSLTLTAQGSGSLCLTAGSSIISNHVKIEKVGAGGISLGPRGTCQDASILTGGSVGTIDIGGIQCQDVDVDLFGSGDVVVQATNSLAGDVFGNGHLKYYGVAPQSIDSRNYMGLVTAMPVSSSYHRPECKITPSKFTKSTGDLNKDNSLIDYDLSFVQDNTLCASSIMLIVAIILRWFNESRRRAREEQRQTLIHTGRQVYG